MFVKKLINRNNFNKHFKKMHPQVYGAGAGTNADQEVSDCVKIVAKPTKSPTKFPYDSVKIVVFKNRLMHFIKILENVKNVLI